MPYGLIRYQQAESLRFLIFSCYERKPYLVDPASNAIVEQILERTRARHDACIYAYVLMPEHVHLLMNEPPKIQVAMFLKSFKQELSRKLKGDRKQFWQTRYFDRNIRGEIPCQRSSGISIAIRWLAGWCRTRRSIDGRAFANATGILGTVQIEAEWLAIRRARAANETHSSRETKAR